MTRIYVVNPFGRYIANPAATQCSSVCQVQGDTYLANYFRPLPDGYWAVSPLGRGKALPHRPRVPGVHLVIPGVVLGS